MLISTIRTINIALRECWKGLRLTFPSRRCGGSLTVRSSSAERPARRAGTVGHLLAALVTASAVFASQGTGTAQAAGPCSSYIKHAFWGYDASPGFFNDEDLGVEPTSCARKLGLFDTKDDKDAFAELEKEVGMLNNVSMFNQFACHLDFAPTKPYYDLEPWRPNVGLSRTILEACNPAPTSIVWNVGVGNGISATTGGAIRNQLLRDGPPALGQPFGEVHSHGSTCFQLFSGGWRGAFGGASGLSAIVASNCSGAGVAYWIGDYFMGYYEKFNPIVNALNVIGYPTIDSTRWRSGWKQEFAGGNRGPNILVRADTQTEAHDVYEPIMSKYLTLGGPNGPLGVPTTDQYQCNGGSVCQKFMGGSLTVAAPATPSPSTTSTSLLRAPRIWDVRGWELRTARAHGTRLQQLPECWHGL
jgi:hypothetical protein